MHAQCVFLGSPSQGTQTIVGIWLPAPQIWYAIDYATVAGPKHASFEVAD